MEVNCSESDPPTKETLLRFKYLTNFVIRITTHTKPGRFPWDQDVSYEIAEQAGCRVCYAYEGGFSIPYTSESRDACKVLGLCTIQGQRDLRFQYDSTHEKWNLLPKDNLPFTLEEISTIRNAMYTAARIESELIVRQQK